MRRGGSLYGPCSGDDRIYSCIDTQDSTVASLLTDGKGDKVDGGTGIDTLVSNFSGETVDISFAALDLTKTLSLYGTTSRGSNAMS